MDYAAESLKLHYQWRGKLDTVPKMEVKDREALSLAYTPGVAQPCLEIQKDLSKSYELTGRWNTVAVVTDGTAVLGLGDIGPEAGMPVMEGKCVLFKAFGGVNAVPLCVRSKDVDEIVNTVALLAGSFGGVNLEDISAPRCFEIERKLKEKCDIPIFHDDQHGTAIIVAAALQNALKLVNKKIEDVTAVFSGAGAAGTAIFKLLWSMGLRRAVLCDINGVVYPGRSDLADNPALAELADLTRPSVRGGLARALEGADVFVGVSAPNLVTADMVRSMADKPILFPMANPTPEIMPDEALAAGAAVVGTGRSDFPNQINNVLAFPGVFRGAFDVRASDINEEMKLAAAKALADLVGDDLSPDYIVHAPFDERVCPAVAKAVAEAAKATGVARIRAMMTLEHYLEDPCRRCSIPYWKFRQIHVPHTMAIVHREDFDAAQYAGWTDTPYFRLLHRLDNLPEASSPDIRLMTATPDHIPSIVSIINHSYPDLSVTEEQVRGFTKSPAYCPGLWVLAIHAPSGEMAGCALADLDRESGEGSLEWVQVLPCFRRQGIGRLLVSELLRRMRGTAQFATVSGKCYASDCPELLYRACGFTGNDVWHILTK